MKRLLFVCFLAAVLIFTACSKDKQEPGFYKLKVTSGSLQELVGEDTARVVHLTLEGTLNEKDFQFIRSLSALEVLDISEVAVKAIPDGTYLRMPLLEKVVLPETLEIIGKSVFADCKQLREINFPESLKAIGEFAFITTDLREVVLPSSLVKIGDYAIDGSPDLTRLVLPEQYQDTLWGIGGSRPELKSLVIPPGTEFLRWSMGYEDGMAEETSPTVSFDTLRVMAVEPPAASIYLTVKQQKEMVLVVPQGSKKAYAESDKEGWGNLNELSNQKNDLNK